MRAWNMGAAQYVCKEAAGAGGPRRPGYRPIMYRFNVT
jgi:hypothetical protein